ncbi:MAG: glycosyltransferase family 2 protein [Eubacterium sp.]
MPLFSIIVPVYNVEKYLNQCVESIVNQTYSNFEIILVDDNSPDNCPALCDEWAEKDSRIKVIHKANGGASSARNAGIDASTGDYILFVDSDDFYNSNDTLMVLKDKIENTKSDIVVFGCTDWNMITDKTVISRTGYDLDLINQGDKDKTFHYLLSQKMLPGGPTIFCTSRRVIEDNQIRFKEGIQDEDYDYVLSAFMYSSSIFAVDNPFYTYRYGRNNSVTASASIKMIDGIAYTIEKWSEICEKCNNEQLKKDLLNYIAFVFSTGYVVAGRMKNKEEKKRAFSILKKYGYILDYGYWRKTRIIKFAVKIFGVRLFSALSVKYFNLTHIQ